MHRLKQGISPIPAQIAIFCTIELYATLMVRRRKDELSTEFLEWWWRRKIAFFVITMIFFACLPRLLAFFTKLAT